MKFHLLSPLCLTTILTTILESLGHPTADISTISGNAYKPDFTITHKLICESGHSGFECFRLFGTQCGPQREIWSPSPDSNSEHCTPKQCQCISRAPEEILTTAEIGIETDPQAGVGDETKEPREITYRIQIKLVCDKGIGPQLCKMAFGTSCSNQRRVISPAHEGLGSCTSKQCHCVARAIFLNLPNEREVIDRETIAEDYQHIDEVEEEVEGKGRVNVEDI